MGEYAKSILMAEEIGRHIKSSLKDVQVEHIVKTDEKRPTRPHIINHKLTNADQIYEIRLPVKGVKAWSLSLRENQDLLYSFEPSFSTYVTLKKGATLNEDTAPKGLDRPAIYVKCSTADVTVELELWS